MLLSEDFFRPQNTAIRRKAPSPFARQLVESGCLSTQGITSILDFGCGVGADVLYYREAGLIADGFDPHSPFGWDDAISRSSYHLVVCMFVLNVIPGADSRKAIVQRVRELMMPNGFALLVARSSICIEREARSRRWEKYQDGYISSPSRRTFQKGFTDIELIELFDGGCSVVDFDFKVTDSCAVMLNLDGEI